MELSSKQQIAELIKDSQKILVCTHANPDGDALGSVLAFYLCLKKLGKEVSMIAPDLPAKTFQFLPAIDELKTSLTSSKDFIISINTASAKVDRLGYKNYPEENKLNITLTPSSGSFSTSDISFHQGGHKFDLVVVLDSADLERLKNIYDDNSELFYDVPVINIDHHPGNDHFGKINWVDFTATSTAEILVSLTESLGRDKPLFDADIATCLLTGIITDTGSFQNSNTTPKSFTIAAQLIAAGARQQEIIRYVYKTKALSTLKLWGKILSKVNAEKTHRFVWSQIGKNDYIETGAGEDESAGVVDELLKTAPEIDFALLLSERKDGLHGSLRGVQKGVNVSEIAKLFNGGGHEMAAAFHLQGGDLANNGGQVIEQIKQFQARRLNIEPKIQTDLTPNQNGTLEMPPIDNPSST